MRAYADFQRYNAFCPPCWRFDRILQLVDSGPTPKRSSPRDDLWVRRARNFVLRWRFTDPEERDVLMYEDPGLFFAYDMWEKRTEDPNAAISLEARLLSGQTTAEIADRCGILPSHVRWYERLFFCVRERSRQHDWIVRKALAPAMALQISVDPPQGSTNPNPVTIMAKPMFDGTLKFFSYFGGPPMCEFMVSGFRQDRRTGSGEDLAPYLDAHWMDTIRRRSAQAFMTCEVNKYSVMQLAEIHARIIEIERSSDGSEKAKSQLEGHVAALMGAIPWTVGTDGRRVFAGTPMAGYDDAAAELRDSELLVAASGRRDPKHDELATMKVPPPSTKARAAQPAVLK